MTPKQFFTGRALVFAIILVLLGGFHVLNAFIYNEKQAETPQKFEPYQATLTGTQECLPHKDTTGPQTEECAIGFVTDTGEHYALDFNHVHGDGQTHTHEYNTYAGVRFTATGTITPLENISSNHWQKYNVQGIFSIDSLTLEEPTKPTTPPVEQIPVAKKCYIGGCSAQLCSDQEGMASTCEYREEYACYKKATCEQQVTGECGWTETAELKACLAQ